MFFTADGSDDRAMMTEARPTYAVISTTIRRDSHDPLRFMRLFRPVHFYREAPYRDMRAQDLSGTVRYGSAAELAVQLLRLRPRVIQGVEPFFLRQLPVALAALSVAHATNAALVVPSLENLTAEAKFGAAMARLMRPAIRRYVRGASLLFAVNEAAAGNLIWAGAESCRIRRAMYGTWGVDLREFAPSGPRRDFGVARPVVLFLGRLTPEKGVLDLLRAFADVARHMVGSLVYVGEGPAKSLLMKEASLLGVSDRIRLVGPIANVDVPSALRGADILAAPSRTTKTWSEQVGMSAIQAMACGIPVITTLSGSIAEFTGGAETGAMVAEGDLSALSEALRALMGDPRSRRVMGVRARDLALDRYDAARNVRSAEDAVVAAMDGQS